MSVQISGRQCPRVARLDRSIVDRATLPWALVATLSAYLVITNALHSGAPARELRPLDPPVASASAPVSAVGVTAERSGDQIVIYGRAHNNRAHSLKDVEAVVELVDRAGSTTAVTHGLLSERTLSAYSETTFEAYADDSGRATGYRVRFRKLAGESLGP